MFLLLLNQWPNPQNPRLLMFIMWKLGDCKQTSFHFLKYHWWNGNCWMLETLSSSRWKLHWYYMTNDESLLPKCGFMLFVFSRSRIRLTVLVLTGITRDQKQSKHEHKNTKNQWIQISADIVKSRKDLTQLELINDFFTATESTYTCGPRS